MRVHHSIPTPGPHALRTWIGVAIVFMVLVLMGVLWDRHDLGDGLVLGTDNSVKSVWELVSEPHGVDDLLFGTPSAGQAPTRP